MSDSGVKLYKSDMDNLITMLANKLNKLDKNNTYKFYIVGGAALASYYGLREFSRDIDASCIGNISNVEKDIEEIASEIGILPGWLNFDYEKSESYTPKIVDNSILYKVIENCEFHVASPQLLLCMKLISFRGRPGKFDREDAYKLVEYMRQEGYKVGMQDVIDFFDTLYKPTPELGYGAMTFLMDLGR